MDISLLFSLVLPVGLLNHFDIISHTISPDKVDLYLEEKSYAPADVSSIDVVSHGFTRERIIQDFPFRDKSLYLHIKRRRYLNKQTGKTISRDLTIAFEGTHLSAEFADFLKDIHRYS